MTHLVYFDGECPFCNRMVRFIISKDPKKKFLFAPQKEAGDTLVFVEHYGSERQKRFVYGRGALRICWHLGGLWSLLGLLSFLPNPVADFCYKLIARRRHLLARNSDLKEIDPDRILQ